MIKKFRSHLFCLLLFYSLNAVDFDNTASATSTIASTSKESSTTGSSSVTTTTLSTIVDNDSTTTDGSSTASGTPASTTVDNDSTTTDGSSSASMTPASTTVDNDSTTTDGSSSASGTPPSTTVDNDSTTTDGSSSPSGTPASTTVDTDSTTTDGSSLPSRTPASTTVDDSTTTTSAPSTAIPTTTGQIIKDQRSFIWTPSNMESNWIVYTADEGYYISVTVSGVEMTDGNYLLIEKGTSHSTDATEGRVFANTVDGPLKYLFKTTSVYALCSSTPETSSFTVKFEQIGAPTTTSIVTTTTPISVPPTKPSDSIYLTVNVTGRPVSDYSKEETINAFKKCVVTTAINYCKEQNIVLTRDITNDYVILGDDIRQCPYTWPDSENCVRIKFSLPIFYDESKNPGLGYQLNTNHLSVMWLRKDELDLQCFSRNNFEAYTEPDVEQSIIWWAVGISLVLAFFIVLLWLLRIFSGRLKTAIRKRRNSDTLSIMSSKKDSLSSLTPHYLQDTPKLFEP